MKKKHIDHSINYLKWNTKYGKWKSEMMSNKYLGDSFNKKIHTKYLVYHLVWHLDLELSRSGPIDRLRISEDFYVCNNNIH